MRLIAVFLIYFMSIASAKKGVTEVSIQCVYSNFNHFYYGPKWTCSLSSNPDITQPGVTITDIKNKAARNDEVEFFVAIAKTIRYFPRGLDRLFPNLYGLRFENTQLSFLSKEDLEPFPQLKYLIIYANRLEYIAEDLLENNPLLEVVSFRSNQIKYIAPETFEKIRPKLKNLWLDGTITPCGLTAALNSADAVKQLDKMRTSACADIDNAPPFFIIQQRDKLRGCELCKEETTNYLLTLFTQVFGYNENVLAMLQELCNTYSLCF